LRDQTGRYILLQTVSVLVLGLCIEEIVNMHAILEILMGGAVLIVGFFLTYMSSHMISEKKLGCRIPLPWEKKTAKVFDKSDIKYRDGDNT